MLCRTATSFCSVLTFDMSRQTWRAGTLLAPVPPALVSCGGGELPDNVLTVAWTGILNSDPAKTYVSIRPSRFSHGLIRQNGEFVINVAPSKLVRSVDRAGVITGKDIDKFEACGLRRTPSVAVSCPTVADCPIALECKVTDVVSLGTHDMFIADIVAVTVDDSVIDEEGKLRIEKAGLMAYAHGTYFELGKKIGTFGFSVRKKKKAPRRK